MSPMRREDKTAWQRAKRAADRAQAIADGSYRGPGRPPTGGAKCHGDRAGQRARARERQLVRDGDNGEVITHHPLLARARAIALRFIRPDRGAVQYRPTHEDAVGHAALALVEGSEPEEAVRAYLRAERDWEYRVVQEHGWLVLPEDQEGPLVSIGERRP